MFCKYCGKELKDDAEFCPYCGRAQNPDDAKQPKENAEQDSPVKAEKKEKRKSPVQKRSLSRNSAIIIAVVVVIVIAVVAVAGVIGNLGSTYQTEVTKSGSIYTAKSMWIVGEENPTSVGNTSAASRGKTSFTEQIDTIMDSYEESRQTIDANGGRADAGYRMFELLCVIAEELDESGKYAYAAAESASGRYKEMDAEIKYENIQEVNGLYRCAEMLAYIFYEVGGDACKEDIKNIMVDSITYTEPDTENFWECQGQATVAICEYLYRIMEELNLSRETMDDITYDYDGWTNLNEEIEQQDIYVIYNTGERQYVEGFGYIYAILRDAVSGWNITSEYADELTEIEDRYEKAKDLQSQGYQSSASWTEEEIEIELPYLTSVMQCCTYLLEILARALA